MHSYMESRHDNLSLSENENYLLSNRKAPDRGEEFLSITSSVEMRCVDVVRCFLPRIRKKLTNI